MNTPKIITSLALLSIIFTLTLRLEAQPRAETFTVQTSGGGGSAGTLATVEAPGPGQVISFRPAAGANRDVMFISGPDGGAQPLVIVSSAIESAAMAEINEDLKIMSKLVSDATSEDDGAQQQAMGISVSFPPQNSSRPLFVEGYGAIFQTSVRFPLTPPDKEEPKTPPANTNSAWDNARRELSGASSSEELADGPKREPFDAGRVESLKKTLLKALANANHIRQLKPSDKIIIVVRNNRTFPSRITGPQGPAFPGVGFGSGAYESAGESYNRMVKLTLTADAEKKPDGGGKETANPHYSTQLRRIIARAPGSGPDKTMTISVKKSDADALAAGKITEDEFNKRASVVTY